MKESSLFGRVGQSKCSQAIDSGHEGSWYADFKNEQYHYIIFRDKVFKVDRRSKEQYDEANKFGGALGIPSYQLDFSPQIKRGSRRTNSN